MEMGVSEKQKDALGERYQRFVQRSFRRAGKQIFLAALLAFLAAVLLQQFCGV